MPYSLFCDLLYCYALSSDLLFFPIDDNNNSLTKCYDKLDAISFHTKGLAKLANIACQTLLFVSVSLAMDNQRTLLFGQEQRCLASNVGQFRQALRTFLFFQTISHWLCFSFMHFRLLNMLMFAESVTT